MGVEVARLTRVAGKTRILSDVEFSVESGVLALLGPAGAGKTALLDVLATVAEPTDGSVVIDGLDVRRQRPQVRRRIGYVPHETRLYPNLTVWETLDYLGLLHRMDNRTHRYLRIEWALEKLGLTALRKTQLGALGPGEVRLVALGQALLAQPFVLLLDDPTGGLEPAEAVRVRELLVDLAHEALVIFATRSTADVEAAATSVAVLQAGRMKYFGTPDNALLPLRDRTWELDVPADQARPAAFLETGMRRTPAGMRLRGVADSPPAPGAAAVAPQLDDVYSWLLARDDHA